MSEIASTSFIVRKVPVNRNRSLQEALDATLNVTGRMQITDSIVVNSIPRGDSDGDEVEVCFFKPEVWEYTRPGFMSNKDLEKCFRCRGFRPADPIYVAAVNEADPAFADQNPHGTYWKDADDNWCYATFRRCGVNVHRRHVRGWVGAWSFAGIRE